MMNIFFPVFLRLIIFLFFFFLGVFLKKNRILPDETAQVLSLLVTYVFLPAINFSSLSSQFTIANLKSNISFFLSGGVLVVMSILLSVLTKKLIQGNRIEKLTVEYNTVVPNCDFMGTPLIAIVFGPEILAAYLIFGIIKTSYVYGYMFPKWKTNGNINIKVILKKVFNPPLIALFAGAGIGLSGIRVPEVIGNICNSASDCIAACSMIAAGFVLGGLSAKEILAEKRAYIMTLLRLIILPGICIAIAYGFQLIFKLDSRITLLVVLYTSLPVGLNPVLFSEANGDDGSFASICCFDSMILCLVTMPVIWSVAYALLI